MANIEPAIVNHVAMQAIYESKAFQRQYLS